MLNVLFLASLPEDARYVSSMSRGLWSVATVPPESGLRGIGSLPDAAVSEGYDVILIDPATPGLNASRLLSALADGPDAPPVVVVTRESSVAFARMAERFGVREYVLLPCEFERLREVVARAVASRRPASRDWIRPPLVGDAASGFIGSGPAARRLLESVYRVARSRDPVLILGDTGTGKDLVARMIHDNSPVSGGRYEALNVSCVPESLAESQLFGSARGGFTGAVDMPGIFESADGGTVFLDEIGSLAPSVQPKLLRVLEDGRVRRVGARSARTVSFRLVCATHQDLPYMTRSGQFRSDLFYRINVLRVEVPPLRERVEDIELLAVEHLVRYRKRLSRASIEKLRGNPWEGNVRELRSCLARAANAARGDVIYPGEILF